MRQTAQRKPRMMMGAANTKHLQDGWKASGSSMNARILQMQKTIGNKATIALLTAQLRKHSEEEDAQVSAASKNDPGLESLQSRTSFTSLDNVSHTLFSAGEGANARIMVASTPVDLRYVAEMLEMNGMFSGVDGGPETVRQVAKCCYMWEDAARSGDENRHTIMNTQWNKLLKLMPKFMMLLNVVTGHKPLVIDWQKPDANNYPTLYFGPLSTGSSIPQDELKGAYYESKMVDPRTEPELLSPFRKGIWDRLALAEERAAWRDQGYAIDRYMPTAKKTLPFGMGNIGLGNAYQVHDNFGWNFSRPESGNSGGQLMDAIAKLGFNPAAEGMHADHAVEPQLGASADTRDNLWVLDSGFNRGSGLNLLGMRAHLEGVPQVGFVLGDIYETLAAQGKSVKLRFNTSHGGRSSRAE